MSKCRRQCECETAGEQRCIFAVATPRPCRARRPRSRGRPAPPARPSPPARGARRCRRPGAAVGWIFTRCVHLFGVRLAVNFVPPCCRAVGRDGETHDRPLKPLRGRRKAMASGAAGRGSVDKTYTERELYPFSLLTCNGGSTVGGPAPPPSAVAAKRRSAVVVACDAAARRASSAKLPALAADIRSRPVTKVHGGSPCFRSSTARVVASAASTLS